MISSESSLNHKLSHPVQIVLTSYSAGDIVREQDFALFPSVTIGKIASKMALS